MQRIGLVKVRPCVHRDGRSTLYGIYVMLHNIYLLITRTIVFARLDFFRCGVLRFSGWCIYVHIDVGCIANSCIILYYIILYNVLLQKNVTPLGKIYMVTYLDQNRHFWSL